jgi:site-specific recombinase XerC
LGVKQEFEFNEWYEKDQKKIREKFGEENYQRLEKVSLAKVLSEFFEFYSVYVQQGLEEGQEIFSIDISSS